MRDRDDPVIASRLAGLEQLRQPHGRPAGAADPGPAHDDALPFGELQPAGPAVGHADRAHQVSVGARPDLGSPAGHRGPERLDELQHQLVHRYGAAHPGAERGDHLVGGRLATPHEPISRPNQPMPYRHSEHCDDQRGDQALEEDRTLMTARCAVDPHDDHQVDDGDDRCDAGCRDRFDECRDRRSAAGHDERQQLPERDDQQRRSQPDRQRLGASVMRCSAPHTTTNAVASTEAAAIQCSDRRSSLVARRKRSPVAMAPVAHTASAVITKTAVSAFEPSATSTAAQPIEAAAPSAAITRRGMVISRPLGSANTYNSQAAMISGASRSRGGPRRVHADEQRAYHGERRGLAWTGCLDRNDRDQSPRDGEDDRDDGQRVHDLLRPQDLSDSQVGGLTGQATGGRQAAQDRQRRRRSSRSQAMTTDMPTPLAIRERSAAAQRVGRVWRRARSR